MSDTRRSELRRFLRARRAELKVEDVGLRAGPRRRTPGLRREEVASLADVGVTWYTWLEQGRDIRVSREALDRIANALRLSASDSAYLFALAAVEPTSTEVAVPAVDACLQLVLDSIEGCAAFVVNPRLDVVAFNQLADRIYDFDGFEGPFARNHVWRGYMDPARRRLYPDWEQMMTLGVGLLRTNYATRVGDPTFVDLIDGLLAASAEFRRVWDMHHTTAWDALPVRLAPRGHGIANLHSMRYVVVDNPGQFLFVLVPADERTARAFAAMRRRDAGRRPRARAQPARRSKVARMGS
jgi:transcriptional regulator with XRE-family HTH domain